MEKSYSLDQKIIELQKAVKQLKNNRDYLVKELESIKQRVDKKTAIS